MEIELVWLEGTLPFVEQWPLVESIRFDQLFESFPADVRAKLQPFQPCRYSKKIHASTVIRPGDQIAWLPSLQVDPQAARVARVEKQRKERWRLKSVPKTNKLKNPEKVD
jgi:putative ubiquitin-RnfH superfamily antitoxin RatB of RatAB toxin-antitoxin module